MRFKTTVGLIYYLKKQQQTNSQLCDYLWGNEPHKRLSHFTFRKHFVIVSLCMCNNFDLCGVTTWFLTSWGRVTTAPCCVNEEILCAKYSLQEASTERWALKLWPSTTTVTSHSTSRRRCSSRELSTWEEWAVDSNVNTDDRGADMATDRYLFVQQTHRVSPSEFTSSLLSQQHDILLMLLKYNTTTNKGTKSCLP